jgi:hypothetical protein
MQRAGDRGGSRAISAAALEDEGMVEAVGGAAASVRSVNGTAIATAIATALPIHKSRNVSAEARELEPPLLAGAGFLAPPFGFGLLPFPIVAKLERAREGALGVFDPDRSPPILCVSWAFLLTAKQVCVSSSTAAALQMPLALVCSRWSHSGTARGRVGQILAEQARAHL